MNCKDIQAAIDSASRRNPISQPASAHIAGCLDCRRYSDQSDALLALLSAQPRVAAPADFDFRLRARIARAESQPAGPFAFLENFFGQSFSIKQAAASLAALAMMVAGTTFYFTNGSRPVSDNTMVAQVAQPAPQAPVKAMVTPVEKTESVVEMPQPTAIRAASTRLTPVKMRPAVLTESPATQAAVARNVAHREDTIRVFNRERGQIMEASNRTTLYGAEGLIARAKPAVDAGF